MISVLQLAHDVGYILHTSCLPDNEHLELEEQVLYGMKVLHAPIFEFAITDLFLLVHREMRFRS